jgi:thiol-disulfide isomerase/thioredoxin
MPSIRSLAGIQIPLLLLFGSAAGAGAAEDPEARAFLESARARYQQFQTYQDRLEVSVVIKGTDAEGEPMDHSHDLKRTFKFARPDRFLWESKEATVRSNGRSRWTYVSKTRQYMENEVQSDDEMDADLFGGPVHVQYHAHPVGAALLHPDRKLADLFPAITGLTGLSEETREGVSYHCVRGTLAAGWAEESEITFAAWFRAADGLLTEIRIDATAAYQAMMNRRHEIDQEEDEAESGAERAQPKIEKAEVVLSFLDIVVDGELPDEAFVFQPADDDKKVRTFRRPRPDRSEQLKLIGKPAPDISGAGLDGEPLALADWRGRVVLLDFWATWCGPCVAAIPHIQKLAEQFADQPVTVLGINRDREGAEKKVASFLEKKQITFRQFMDVEGTVAETYKVTGIPCSVLIDTNGIVQDVKVGFSSGGEDDLAENIRRLLDGKVIHDPQELAQRLADEAADEEDPDSDDAASASAASAVLEEVHPELLAPGHRETGQFSGYSARPFDLDGDGRPELLLPDWRQTVYIVSADGAAVSKVRLQGRGQSYNLRGCQPVRRADGMYWLASFSRWSSGGASEKTVVDFFSPDGARLWSYTPEYPAGLNGEIHLAAGDLDGDGEPELVVGITLYRRQKIRANAYTHDSQRSYLAILDGDGQLRSLRNAGIKDINHLWIAAAPEPGQPAAILCIGDNRIQRFTLAAPEASVAD